MKLIVMETVEAGHRLENKNWDEETNKKVYGKCYGGDGKETHGHQFCITVTIEGKPDDSGMVVNFSEIKKIIRQLDHRCLNNIIEIPTAENIVTWLIEKLRNIGVFDSIKVSVAETANNIVEDAWSCGK